MAGCSGCWAADRSVYNTPAGMQKLQFSGRADGAEYRTSAIIAQIPKKNSPERGFFMATRRGDTLIFPKPPVIAAHACVGGKKEGESPLAAEFDELHSDNRLGQASWEAAETQLQLQTARLCLKKPTPPKGCEPPAGRRPAGPVHSLGLCGPGAGPALCGAVRGLQHHGRGAGCWGLPVQRRNSRRPAGHDLQPLLHRRAAVPHPLSYGAVRTPPPNGLPRRQGPACSAPPGRGWHPGRDLWPGAGSGHPGHQQHGGRHGSGCGGNAPALPHRYQHPAAGVRCHLHRRPGPCGQSAVPGAAGRRGPAHQEPCGLRFPPL